mgnify:CR=1 FL=1
MTALDDAQDALDGGALVYVDVSIPDAHVIQAKLEAALDGRTDVTLVVLPAGDDSAESVVDDLASHTESGTVAVAYGLDSAVVSPAMGQEYARDLLDRASSINNHAHDALVTFVGLATERLDEIAEEQKTEETVGVPTGGDGGSPAVPIAVTGGGIIAVVVVGALIARSARRNRKPRERWETNEDGDIIGLTAKKMTPTLWLDLVRHLEQIAPPVMNREQREFWDETVRDLHDIAPRWRRMNDGGLATEAMTIATEYLPRISARYEGMPRDILDRENARGTTPRDALTQQLTLISERADELRVASFDKDVRSIEYTSEVVKARYTKIESEFDNL